MGQNINQINSKLLEALKDHERCHGTQITALNSEEQLPEGTKKLCLSNIPLNLLEGGERDEIFKNISPFVKRRFGALVLFFDQLRLAREEQVEKEKEDDKRYIAFLKSHNTILWDGATLNWTHNTIYQHEFEADESNCEFVHRENANVQATVVCTQQTGGMMLEPRYAVLVQQLVPESGRAVYWYKCSGRTGYREPGDRWDRWLFENGFVKR